tara:strand:+ start:235 stop:615 length:381 start_codon:yes stop_codon:yes gene_type:complete
MAKFKYFTYSEFDCKSGIGQGEIFMNHKFIEMLDDARTIANVPFIITSGYRTKEYNAELIKKGYKASPNSSHCKGVAADIKIRNSHNRFKIIQALVMVGFKRIGVAKDFIHCDLDFEKKQNILWTY